MAPIVSNWPEASQTSRSADFATFFSERMGDCIVSGFTPTDAGGLTVSIAAGVGYCAGRRYSVTGPTTLTMGNSTTNYIYFDPTTKEYLINISGIKPTNALYIAQVTTDTSDITSFINRVILSGTFSVPKGIIVMWSGRSDNIPSGWTLCDGTSGTPNLRDRFVVGAGTSYAVGGTGGQATHSVVWGNGGISGGTEVRLIDGINNGTITNLPPYYALAFIMKTE